MALIGRLRERRLIRRAAEQALAERPVEQFLGAPMDSAQDPNTGPIPRISAPSTHPPQTRERRVDDDAPPRADDVFGGLVVAPWMFRMRERPWYRTKPAMIALGGAAAALVISGVLLALRTPAAPIEKPTPVPATVSPPAPSPPPSPEPPPPSIPPSPSTTPPPSPTWVQPYYPDYETADPGTLQEPPPAEPMPPEEPPPPAEPPPEPSVGE